MNSIVLFYNDWLLLVFPTSLMTFYIIIIVILYYKSIMVHMKLYNIETIPPGDGCTSLHSWLTFPEC